jgi:predicted ATPase
MLNTGQLPVRLVPLVGRQRELGEVVDALTQSRLMSLTGPGGTGKTRLALAASDTVRAHFADGVCWVELAPINDPAIVPEAVASGLGAPESPGQDAAVTIAEFVGDRSMLIVLDNCEHVAAAVADLADRLLGACPALSILTTSRELLGVDGERSWPVPPLSLPDDDVAPVTSVLAGYDAVRFFEQRAQLVLPSFRLTDDNAAAVLKVCRRLDGLPLAIELAAARMRVLSAGQLADRLDDIFTVLTGGSRTSPARHQALRATLDWSHDLLEEDERAVFRRLAVFSGGFTLTAAGKVAAGSDIPAERMLELLARLADKSLLRVDHAGGDARYHLLATVRDYARERLVLAGEDEPARRAHLRFFAELVERAEPRLEYREQAQADGLTPGSLSLGRGWGPGSLERTLDRLDTETPNLRAALEFARESGDAVAALRIAGPLGRYAYLRGHYHEVRQWMDAAVTADPGAPAALRAKALLGRQWPAGAAPVRLSGGRPQAGGRLAALPRT